MSATTALRTRSARQVRDKYSTGANKTISYVEMARCSSCKGTGRESAPRFAKYGAVSTASRNDVAVLNTELNATRLQWAVIENG